MACHSVTSCQLIRSGMILLHIVTQLLHVCITSSDLFSPVIECVEVNGSYWWPEPIIKCDLQCSSHCTCSLGNISKVVVNCSNRNVSVEQVPYPSKLTHFSWAFNDLSGIGKDSFSGLTDLKQLDLLNNLLTEIYPGTFWGLVNMILLDLHNNMLKKIRLGTFKGLINLQILNLHNNLLTDIQAGSFEVLTSLVSLRLDTNMLRHIQPLTCKELISLYELDLKRNMLLYIQVPLRD